MNPVILLVDDNEEILEFLEHELIEKYTVIKALNGEQAFTIIKEEAIQLVICDVMMPVMNGFELCRIIKTHAQGQETPVLFLTSCKEKEDLMTGREVGASGYLTKPFYAKDLYKEVERLLAA